MKYGRFSPSFALGIAAFFGTALAGSRAHAQSQTFKLDRLEVPGAPDDTLMIARPVTHPYPTFFAQLGLGYSLNPLRTDNVYSIPNQRTLLSSPDRGVIQNQLTAYTNVGVQFLNRFTVGVALPVTPWQSGKNPQYQTSTTTGNTKTSTVNTAGPSLGDIRLDLRGVIVRSDDQRASLGASLSVFAPTGTSTNFGADPSASYLLSVQAEYAFRYVVLMATTGVHLRPYGAINDPVSGSGLGVGNEWRWQAGAFAPLRDGAVRLGATIAGQTGLENGSPLIGDTSFTKRNTPVEWNLEARGKLGTTERLWLGGGAGSFINAGYGAPDLRVTLLFGGYMTTEPDPPPGAPRTSGPRFDERDPDDADGDGIKDAVDACPSDPEDGKGDKPADGCPTPPDRDADKIIDAWDKCPDEPEDKDGIEDGDGCPEVDFDGDGVPDEADACPREPGSASSDKMKNGCPQFISMDGSVIHVLQQVHFATNSATILQDSFAMLQEIASLLGANDAIKRVSIEGHTDNRGDPTANKKLSQDRAESVRAWLVGRGVDAERLEAHGFGQERPLDSNASEAGRQNNRRVEFKIVEQTDPNAPHKQ